MLASGAVRFMRWYRASVHRRERRRARFAVGAERYEDAEVEKVRLDPWAIS